MYQPGLGKPKHLVNVIATAMMHIDPSDGGPVLIKADLWDGRVAVARYCHGVKYEAYDFTTRDYTIGDTEKLTGLVEELLSTGRPIRTSTGAHDEVCDLEWTIEWTASSDAELAERIAARNVPAWLPDGRMVRKGIMPHCTPIDLATESDKLSADEVMPFAEKLFTDNKAFTTGWKDGPKSVITIWTTQPEVSDDDDEDAPTRQHGRSHPAD